VGQFLQQTINGLSVGSVYALLGLGVTLLWGTLHLLNFAHGQFITWGVFGVTFALHSGLPFWLAVIIGLVTGMGVAVLLDRLVIGPLLKLHASEFGFVVATIGFGLAFGAIIQWRTGGLEVGYPRGHLPTGALHVGSLIIPTLQLITLVVSIVVGLLLIAGLNWTHLGRSFRTVAYSREISELLGVNSRLIYTLAFAVSGAVAALGGIFIASDTSVISYGFGNTFLLTAFAVVIVGGLGSPKGAVVGGLLLGLFEVYVTVYVSQTFRQAVAYVAIIVVLMLRPQGLFGEKVTSRV
jgi:branched-chain amino acid transport system permease protein